MFRVAVVGAGGIAGAHAAALRELAPRATLVAVADPDHERLAAFGDRWAVPRRYSDLADLLRAGEVDVVHLCTPPGLHAGQAVACLRAGMDVVCEKPPALSLSQMGQMVAAEAATGHHVATIFQHRFGSAALRCRRLIADGLLGVPRVAVCNTLWFRPDSYFRAPWRGRWDSEGGGPTMGHGIHQLDLLVSLLGPWRDVRAVAARQVRPTQTEDVSCAVVRFECGAVATMVHSLLSPRETSYVRIDLDRASVEVEHLYGYTDGDWRITPAPGHEQAVQAAWSGHPRGRPSGHAAQLGAVLDALERGEPPPVTSADASMSLELVAATYASAFSDRTVERGEIGPDGPFARRMDGTGAPWAVSAGRTGP